MAEHGASAAIIRLATHILPNGQVLVHIAPTSQGASSPEQSTVADCIQGPDGNTGLSTDSTMSASCRGSPASSSQLSFEHLSDHFSPPSAIADDEDSPPSSLPDLDDASHDDLEHTFAFALRAVPDGNLPSNGDVSGLPVLGLAHVPLPPAPRDFHDNIPSQHSDANAADKNTTLPGSSIADEADIKPMNPRLSAVECAIAQLQAGEYPLHHDVAASDAASAQKGDDGVDSSSSADQSSGSAVAPSVSPSQSDSSAAQSKAVVLEAYLAESPSSDNLIVTVSSNALAAFWKLLQECGFYTQEATGYCLDALPTMMAARIRRANSRLGMVLTARPGHIRWIGAAVGLSMTSLAVVSLLLVKSYRANWQLRAAMARKDDDILKLVGQVVTLQRNMFRPHRVQVQHLSSSCAFPGLGAL